MALGRAHLVAQIADVGPEVDLLHRPRVLDGVAVHLEEDRVGHRAEREAHPRIEDARRAIDVAHWHASHDSGFSSEHASAFAARTPSSLVLSTVALAMRVAGRDRK